MTDPGLEVSLQGVGLGRLPAEGGDVMVGVVVDGVGAGEGFRRASLVALHTVRPVVRIRNSEPTLSFTSFNPVKSISGVVHKASVVLESRAEDGPDNECLPVDGLNSAMDMPATLDVDTLVCLIGLWLDSCGRSGCGGSGGGGSGGGASGGGGGSGERWRDGEGEGVGGGLPGAVAAAVRDHGEIGAGSGMAVGDGEAESAGRGGPGAAQGATLKLRGLVPPTGLGAVADEKAERCGGGSESPAEVVTSAATSVSQYGSG